MWKNYLKVAFRNLAKNKVFAFINVIGLGIALACCIVAYLNWEYNSKFDSHHENSAEIYRINFIRNINGRSIKNGSCPFPIAKNAQESIAQISETARYIPTGGNFKVENAVFNTGLSAVDPSFVELFSYEMVEGTKPSLADNRSIWVNTELKEKYWPGHGSIIGETLTYIDGDTRIDFKVGAVFEKPPSNSSFQAEALINYDALIDIRQWDENNWANFNSTFVRIQNPDDVSAVVLQLQAYVDVQNKAKEDYKVAKYYLDPFDGMAVRAEKEGLTNHWFSQSLPTAAASAPGIMALLLLLIACFNFTNTSIAAANRRIKEIGIRKVMGSQKRQIMFQFLGENLLLTFLALLAGIVIAAFLVPAYSAMWIFLDIKFNLFQNLQLLTFLILLLFFAAIIAGSYPALYVSNFQPNTIFRGSVKFSGTNLLTRILLTLQFAISLIAIICGFVFAQNAKFQENYDMGFDLETVVSAYVKDENGYRTLRNELMDIPQIKEMAGSRHNMTSSWYTDPIRVESKEIDVNLFDIGPGYLSTIGATIVAGRDFMANSQNDVANSVIINQELANVLGWDDPIDRRIMLRDTVALTVIGMVKDIYFEGDLFDQLEPMMLRSAQPDRFRFLAVKTDVQHAKEVKTLMDAKWQSIFPDELSTVRFMEEDKADSAEVNANIKVLFIFLGLVAIILSAIGLFSMVSLNINKRLKEIGIRRVLGASTRNIASRITKEFIFILSISCILGSLGGYFLANMLMASIWAYYVPITIVVFVFATGILLLVSGLTIGGKVFKAASTIPAHVLRD